MKSKSREHAGHHIELRVRGSKPELLIDDAPFEYGQLPDGLFFLHDYAYDWSGNLITLAQSFIDYQLRAEKPERAISVAEAERNNVHIRKDYRDLTSSERYRFVQALHHLKFMGVVDEFAREHEAHFDHGIHGGSHFLPWHRDFIRRFENELRTHHPDITIPYWNSTVDQLPFGPLWDDDFLGQFNDEWGLGRRLGSATLPEPDLVEDALRSCTYTFFRQTVEDGLLHTGAHNWVGGKMAAHDSPADPVFYLHHCWVDVLWAQWQLLNRTASFLQFGEGEGYSDPMHSVATTPAEVIDHRKINIYDYPQGFQKDSPRVDVLALYDRSAGEAAVVGFDASGDANLDRTNSDWRTTWEIVVAGDFIGNRRAQLLLYDRGAREAAVVGFDVSGKANLDTTNRGWRRTWDVIVAGNFLGDCRSQLLLYDRRAGEAAVVGFDRSGDAQLDRTNSGWRTTGDVIAVGDFLGTGKSQSLLVDRAAGESDVVGFDQNGNAVRPRTNGGWRKTWNMIVVGDFVGSGHSQVLLYDRNAREVDVMGFDRNGFIDLNTTTSGWRRTWDLIEVGDFLGNGRSQLLLYDRGAGEAAVVGFDANGVANLDTTNRRWRKTWERIVVGNFIANGRSQALLYDRDAREAAVVGFDENGNANLDTTNSEWRRTWNVLAPIEIGNGTQSARRNSYSLLSRGY